MSRRWFAIGLALFLGVLGLQWFYLGRFRRGLLYVGLGLFGLSLYLGVIDAIRWLCLSDTEFERRYSRGRVGRQRRKWQLNSVQAPISATVDDEVDRLRREWQVETYDCGHIALRAQSTHGPDGATATNPATGLPMVGGLGGFDISGHTYGTGFEQDNQMGWQVDQTHAHWRSDDHRFNQP